MSGDGATGRQRPDDKEISDKLFDSHIKPFLPEGPDGPKVTENSAVTLINRYVSLKNYLCVTFKVCAFLMNSDWYITVPSVF